MKRINANHYQTSERYYKIPKLLFESDRYKDMKLEVKVAYAVLKDRLELSLSKGWIDDEGSIYLVYSNAKLMDLLGCSKSKLLSIKKTLREYGLMDEIQQSSSEKGRLANKIYLGELEHDTPQGLIKDGGSVQKTLGGSENKTSPVLNSAPSETEDSETNISETDVSDYSFDDEEDMTIEKVTDEPVISRKIDKVSPYDKTYIWGLVHDELLKEGFSRSSADYAMSHFEDRYAYAVKHMRFPRNAEAIAEYVFNGILAVWNQRIRKTEGEVR